METILERLSEFRELLKVNLVHVICELYLKQNNNFFPYFNKEEEFIINENNDITITLPIDNNGVTEYNSFQVKKYIVTLDENLYVYVNDLDCEIHWNEISVEDLIKLITHLKQKDYESLWHNTRMAK